MKGFVKACLVAVLVFAVAGVVLLIVAAAGGVTRASLNLLSDQGRLKYGPVRVHLGDGFAITIGEEEQEEGQIYEVIEAVYPVLELDGKSGDFRICESHDGMFYVEAEGANVTVKTDDQKLLIQRKDTEGIIIGFVSEPDVVVYVPAGYQFEQLLLNVEAGSLQIETALTADVVSCYVGAGSLEGDDLITAKDRMDLSVDAGKLSLDEIVCLGSLSAGCDAGSLEVEGEIYEDVIASVDAGKLELDLKDQGQEYTYKLQTDAGKIKVNGKEYKEIGRRIILESEPGAPVADLSCGAGTLEISIR